MTVYPSVSVVIPTYNSAQYITEAVESALNQDGCDLDIVVIDDGSIDDTEAVLKKYTDQGLISYYKQENKGSGAARNLGIKKSKGEFICFLDADDTFQPNSINERLSVLSAFLKKTNIGLLCTDFTQITLDNGNNIVHHEEFSRKKFLDDAMSYVKTDDGSVYLFHKEIYFDPLVLRRLIWTGTVMIPRSVIQDVGVFDEELRIAQDIDLWFRIASKYEILFMSNSTATYIINSSSITKNNKLYYESTIKVLNKYLDKEKELPKKYLNKIKKKISELYFSLGYQLYESHEYRQSNSHFRDAILNNSRLKRHYKYYAITLFPDNFIDFVRNIWGNKS